MFFGKKGGAQLWQPRRKLASRQSARQQQRNPRNVRQLSVRLAPNVYRKSPSPAGGALHMYARQEALGDFFVKKDFADAA